MNTITKKYLIAGIVAVAVIATGSLALAVGIFPMPMVLQFGSSGNVLMRGTIDAVNTNSLTVKSWGGDWTVNITGSTRLMPQTSMAQFAVGDFVGIQGTVDQNSNWTVDATVVKDWAVRQIQNNTVNVLAPLISSLNPSSGSAGTTVTIHGSGFLSTNSIYLGNYIISENFIDSNTLSFTVPPSSQFIEGNCGAGLLCPGYVRSFPSGNYNVYVKNANGMSDEVAFTITSSTSGAPSQCPTGQTWVCMGGNHCDMACPASNPNCCPSTPQTCSCQQSISGNQGTTMLAPPAIFGTVVGVNGNTITVSGKITVSSGYPNGSATTSIFTVNAANAQIQQNTAASTIASIAVGDTVLVQGILNGTTMAATFIRDTTNTAQSTNLSSCLPSGVTLDTVVSIDDGGANKITVGQTLNSLGASCNSGQLVDSNNKVIKFYNLVGCWGNPPYNYQQILSQQNQDIQNLKAQYTVITLTCNPSGLHNIS